MRSKFAKAAAVIALPLAMLTAEEAQAQNGVEGWDVKGNEEFVVEDVKMLIQGQWITRDVNCDCDLLKKGKTNTGKEVVYPTPAFYAQFNAESEALWQNIPEDVRTVLEKSRFDKGISRAGIDAMKAHLISSHALPEKVVLDAGRRCKTEYYGL